MMVRPEGLAATESGSAPEVRPAVRQSAGSIGHTRDDSLAAVNIIHYGGINVSAMWRSLRFRDGEICRNRNGFVGLFVVYI